MTVATQTNRIAAVGSGAIGQEVPFLFPITATSDLLVKKRVTATGVETTLDETTNYTVVIIGDVGGTLTTVTAIELTEQIHIIRNTPKTQSLDLEQGGSFNAEDIEDAHDKNTKLAIENYDQITNKAITFPETDASALTTVLPSSIARASKNLTFDSDGNVAASVSVEEGDVSFTTFGTNMAEAANALAGKAVINLDHVFDVRDYGAVGDGSADDSIAITAAIDAAAASGGVVFFPQGTYKFDDDDTVPYNVTLQFVPGALLQIEVGKVVTIQGTILAGNNQIFSGAGFTNTNQMPSRNNICWWPGSSLNDKWDAMTNQFATGYMKKVVYIPRVPVGNPAAWNIAADRYVWRLDGTWDIDGHCNNLIIINEGRISVETGAGLTNAVVFSNTDKIEDVWIPNGLFIECNDEATNAIYIKGGARIYFGAELRAWECVNGLVIEATTSDCTEIIINKLFVGIYSGSALELTGGVGKSIAFCHFKDITAQTTVGASCKVVEISGRVLDFTIDHIYANPVLGPDIDIGIHIFSIASGSPAYHRSNISSGYFDFVTTCIKTEDTSAGAAIKMRNLDIGPIHAGNCTTFADLGYLQECRLDIIDNDDPITVGADCQDIRLITSKGVAANITDNGVRTRINGVGVETANAETPTAASWEIGEVVDFIDSGDASGDGVYLKLPDASWSQIGT